MEARRTAEVLNSYEAERIKSALHRAQSSPTGTLCSRYAARPLFSSYQNGARRQGFAPPREPRALAGSAPF